MYVENAITDNARGNSLLNPKNRWVYAAKVIVNAALAITFLWLFLKLGWVPKIVTLAAFGLVFIHEAAHGIVMRRLDVPIVEVGLGVSKGIFRFFQFEIHVPNVPFRIVLSTLPISAYVDEGKKGKEVIENLPYTDKAFIFGAGILANLFCAIALWFTLSLWGLAEDIRTLPKVIVALAISYAIAKLLASFPQVICAYVFPVLGIGIIALLFAMIAPSLIANFSYAALHGGVLEGSQAIILGPVSIGRGIAETTNLLMGYIYIVILATGLVTTNLLPIPPLDGGHIAGALLKLCFGALVQRIVVVALIVLVGIPLIALVALRGF